MCPNCLNIAVPTCGALRAVTGVETAPHLQGVLVGRAAVVPRPLPRHAGGGVAVRVVLGQRANRLADALILGRTSLLNRGGGEVD